MNSAVAYFRCDASPHIGGGHVMRCLTLADALTHDGWECIFLCNEETLETSTPLQQSPYKTAEANTTPKHSDLLIVDHYGLDSAYETRARSWANHIMVIDDLADRKHDCDILLDQTFNRKKSDYSHLVPESCKCLTGSQYALLRPQFSELREKTLKRRKKTSGKIQNILIFISTIDANNITPTIINSINATNAPLSVNIVLGQSSPFFEDIKNLIANPNYPLRYHIHSEVKNMAELMSEADLAIGAGGTTSWERCALGLPTIALEIADNQHVILNNLDDAGALINLGRIDTLQDDILTQTLISLIKTPERVTQMSQKASRICDGQGAQRTIEEIKNVTSR